MDPGVPGAVAVLPLAAPSPIPVHRWAEPHGTNAMGSEGNAGVSTAVGGCLGAQTPRLQELSWKVLGWEVDSVAQGNSAAEDG